MLRVFKGGRGGRGGGGGGDGDGGCRAAQNRRRMKSFICSSSSPQPLI